ncbi:S-layer homology domain-containing protein [Brevibacillus sp. WF146]|uniref:S-layer homology domain-containing protein n=1 Tax=Brevibacillus sp. WF146 TaxID=319501 RepID=UPI002226F9E8|nr:S-layer homology domain-containing protein [Brevibacillus sp. WF146]UYZ14890.1 S-layer homology domain-containing protein [Brevibacillus sp. WF146]
MQRSMRRGMRLLAGLALAVSAVLAGWAGGAATAAARTEGGPPNGVFADTQSHWAAWEIAEAAKSGLLRGFPDGTFRPDEPVTQEQFMALVERVLPPFEGHEADAVAREHDLSAVRGRWSENTYVHLLAAGIVPTGKPFDTLNRLEAARLLLAALGHQSEGEKYRGTKARFFTDISPADESRVLTVYPVYKLGVMTGYPDGAFRPGEAVSRAQAVVLLGRVKQKIAELYPGRVTPDEQRAMTQAVRTFVQDVMDQQKIHRFDDLLRYVRERKLPVTEKFLQEHFSFMRYEVYDFIRFPRFDELIYYAKIGPDKYRMTVQYYAGDLGGSVDKTFYLSSKDGKTFQLIGKDE